MKTLRFLHRIASYPVFARIALFLVGLMVLWLPLALPIYWKIGNDPNLVTILTMGLLYLLFLGLLKGWNYQVYKTPKWLSYYGLTWKKKTVMLYLQGLSIGVVFTFSLFIIEAMLGWITWQLETASLVKIIAEGWLSASGIGLAEEMFFRGWLLTELEKDYSLKTSLWINSLMFAGLHFIKPLAEIQRTFPQFPALVLLGLILGIAKRRKNNQLGISIGLHAGLVWGYYILNVGKLVHYNDNIHPWIIGIDHNPLAGIMGLLFLSGLGIWVYSWPQKQFFRNSH